MENISNGGEGSAVYSVFLFQMGIWNTIFSKGQEGGTGNGNI